MPRRSRLTRLLLAVSAVVVVLGLVVCLLAFSFLGPALSTLGQRPTPPPTPMAWTALPSPAIARPSWTSFTNADSIRGLALRDRLLWAATDGGVVAWDVASGASVKFTTEHGLAGNRATSAAVAPDGTLWFGTADSGLSHYDGQAWQTFTAPNDLAADEVRDVVVARDGSVWAATPAGVCQWDGRRWRTFAALGTGLGSPDVRALALAPSGVWAATAQGVSFFDGRRWQTYTYQNGLANDDALDVAVAPDGSLWAGTRVGLSHFDGNQWRRFTTADGLAANEIATLAVSPDSSVWIGYGDFADGLTRYANNVFQ